MAFALSFLKPVVDSSKDLARFGVHVLGTISRNETPEHRHRRRREALAMAAAMCLLLGCVGLSVLFADHGARLVGSLLSAV